MFRQLLMMSHAATGIVALLAALWLFVEALNTCVANRSRMRSAALVLAVTMWLTYLIGGHWYVAYYSAEKALITAGPWPAAHEFFMEMKEHVFLTLLLLATWLALAVVRTRPTDGAEARGMVLWSAGLLVLGILSMEGAGALVAMGVKLALLD
jgi:hypothetical protein